MANYFGTDGLPAVFGVIKSLFKKFLYYDSYGE